MPPGACAITMVRLRAARSLSGPRHCRADTSPSRIAGPQLTTGPALARPSGATPTDLFTTRAAQRVALRAGRRDRCGGACPVRVGRLWTRRSGRSIRREHHPAGASGLFPLPVGKPAVCHRVPELMWVNVPDPGGGGTAVEKLAKPCPSEGSTGIDPQRRQVVVWGPAGTLAQNRCRREGVGAGLGMSPSVCAVHSGRADEYRLTPLNPVA